MSAKYLTTKEGSPLLCVQSCYLLQRIGKSPCKLMKGNDINRETIAQCAKRGWSVPIMPNQPTHKMLCDSNKVLYRSLGFYSKSRLICDLLHQRHMERLPQTQAITKSFPWGRVECDGTSNMAIALGRFGVFGTSGCGFWNQRIGSNPHSERASVDLSSSPYATEYQAIVKSFEKTGNKDGKELTGQKHLSDDEGWKLPSKLIPYRDFSSGATRPKLVTEFENDVVDWAERFMTTLRGE